jgi:hypothetical protein
MNSDIPGRQFPGGESPAHQLLDDVCDDLLFPPVLTQRVNESDLGRISEDPFR